jgi:hypothetical protein
VRLLGEAPELGEGLGVVVDPQVNFRIVLGRMNEQGRRLPAALVAARGFAGLERCNEALSERRFRLPEGSRRFLNDFLIQKHVAGHGKAFSRNRPAPVDAGGPRVLADAARCIDDVELPVLAPFVRRREPLHHLRGGHPRAKQLESLPAVMRIDQRLRRERADAALRVRAQGADREEAGRDGDAEGAARRIARYD